MCFSVNSIVASNIPTHEINSLTLLLLTIIIVLFRFFFFVVISHRRFSDKKKKVGSTQRLCSGLKLLKVFFYSWQESNSFETRQWTIRTMDLFDSKLFTICQNFNIKKFDRNVTVNLNQNTSPNSLTFANDNANRVSKRKRWKRFFVHYTLMCISQKSY